jgi:hypothetical protein
MWETLGENLFIALFLSSNTNMNLAKPSLILGVVYIPPSSAFAEYEAHLNNLSINILKHDQNTHMCILGDYNVPGIEWKSNGNDPETTVESSSGDTARLLLESISFLNVKQYNHIPNKNNKILDLVLSDVGCTVIRGDFPLVPEDGHHPSLLIDVPLRPDVRLATQSVPKYNFFKANFSEINHMLSQIDWNALWNNKNTVRAVEVLYDILVNIID